MEAAMYDEVFDYLRGSQYPKDADKNKKRSVRQRAAMFALENDVVVLKGTSRQWITCTEQQQQIIRSCHDCCLGRCLTRRDERRDERVPGGVAGRRNCSSHPRERHGDRGGSHVGSKRG